jgi:hypothetical protein
MIDIFSPKRLPRVLPVAMLIVLGFLAAIGALLLQAGPPAHAKKIVTTQQSAPTTETVPPTQAEVDALNARVDGLSKQADMLKSKEDDLKWILGFILAAATLFAAAQAASTWFSAQTFTKQAENSLAQMEKTEKDIKARYPLYSQMAELWANAFQNLTTILQADSSVANPDEGFYWRRGFYEKMPLKYRQDLISAEQIVPYEIAGQGEPPDMYALKLRRLARFYWGKFIYERSRGAGNLGDLEHAEFLLDQAIRKTGSPFYLLNDRGNIYIEYYKAHSKSRRAQPTSFDKAELRKSYDCARQSFKDSIDLKKEQLRAYFNLAYIEAAWGSPAVPYGNLHAAINHLRDGLRYPKWEHEPVDEFRCNALYNLACYYARLPRKEAACLCVLRKAARFGLVSPEDVDRDFNSKEGDFFPILTAAPPATRQKFRDLEKQLTRRFK